MSQEALVALAREVARDLSAQARIEALADEALAERGLDASDIAELRAGFIDRIMRLGLSAEDWVPIGGCCGP